MKISRFEELMEKAVPWFIAVVFLVILWVLGGCHPYPNKNVIKPDKAKHAQFR
jgi:hypothetical protein